jgi:DNA helicase-2/ATP-dependent DNA helicase PcrA
MSKFCKIKLDKKIIDSFVDRKELSYEDGLLFTYMKGILKGFAYEANIRQVVIDEAQDYNRLQYIIINNIFKKADFTVLGDINQNINPYYHYKSLESLKDLFRGDTKYLELLKTYRSSPEIIDYTNKILNLKHVNAIRRDNNKPVIIRKGVEDIKTRMVEDIKALQDEYKSTAVITKDFNEAEKIYNLIHDDIDISLVDHNSKKFKKDLIIIPAYVSKGLEFDSVIIYGYDSFEENELDIKLLYVSMTRAMHTLDVIV